MSFIPLDCNLGVDNRFVGDFVFLQDKQFVSASFGM